MNIDYVWLIAVPVLFGLGWLAARLDFRHFLFEQRKLPDSYFRGLNHLLNEQPDRAIDAFIEVATLDPETTELHFALGNLFRRRGEVDRALRVHQSLLHRDDLPANQREQALYELAQDCLKAGLLDRAEVAYQGLLEGRFRREALLALMRIYETERDWPRAIAISRQLAELDPAAARRALQFHAEMAEEALQAEPADLTAARAALAAAAGLEPAEAHPRLMALQARVALADGQALEALSYLERAFEHHPAYAGLMAGLFLKASQAAGRTAKEAREQLIALHARDPSHDLFDTILASWPAGDAQARDWALQVLRQHPSLLGLQRLSAHGLIDAHSGLDPTLFTPLLERHARRLGRYVCSHCGFKAQRFHWQCPGCNAWESYSPRRLEETDV
jgi:lipopolysaccharide biosynthesis regulator YciM